jgi:hypothetical protein
VSLLSPGDIAIMHGELVGLSNADLTQIATPGPLADNSDPGTPVPVWTGTAPAFLLEADTDKLSADVEVQAEDVKLRIYDAAGVPADLFAAGADWAGSTVVVADRRLSTTLTRRWSVIALEHEQDGTLDSVLLTLNAPSAP